jgi:enolase-phosphatase E1
VKATVLTDIEGTTSAISFVKDVLFPYARAALPDFVRRHGGELEVRHWLDRAAVDVGGVCQDEVIVECCRAGSTRIASTRR